MRLLISKMLCILFNNFYSFNVKIDFVVQSSVVKSYNKSITIIVYPLAMTKTHMHNNNKFKILFNTHSNAP